MLECFQVGGTRVHLKFLVFHGRKVLKLLWSPNYSIMDKIGKTFRVCFLVVAFLKVSLQAKNIFNFATIELLDLRLTTVGLDIFKSSEVEQRTATDNSQTFATFLTPTTECVVARTIFSSIKWSKLLNWKNFILLRPINIFYSISKFHWLTLFRLFNESVSFYFIFSCNYLKIDNKGISMGLVPSSSYTWGSSKSTLNKIWIFICHLRVTLNHSSLALYSLSWNFLHIKWGFKYCGS